MFERSEEERIKSSRPPSSHNSVKYAKEKFEKEFWFISKVIE